MCNYWEHRLRKFASSFHHKILNMKRITTVLGLLLIAGTMRAQQPLPAVKFDDFAEGFHEPTDIENAGDDRLFVTEKAGSIKIADLAGNVFNDLFLDISAKVKSSGSEQGLLGLAFHPEYATNGYFYVDYIGLDGNTYVSRFQVSNNDPNLADPNSETPVLFIFQPFPNHNGGALKFGPDGYLYISSGDGGREGDPLNAGQNKHSFLGKILRIDVNNGSPYAIPPSNPFVNDTAFAPEIWAYGLRNPWRMSFDKAKGNLWIGDVGQDEWEEVDLQRSGSPGGQNYGWNCTEGRHPFEPEHCNSPKEITQPIAEYPHDGDDCTIIGGFVYRGTQFPNMQGKYFNVDYCSGRIRAVFLSGNQWKMELVGLEDEFAYSAWGEDINGELYVADLEESSIEHVVDTSGMSPQKTLVNGNAAAILWPNPNDGQFTAQWYAGANEQCQLEIVNLLGQKVWTETTTTVEGVNTLSYSGTELKNGEYFLVVHTGNGVMRTPFTIE
jgi:glucose/arabinose dehydrogenase